MVVQLSVQIEYKPGEFTIHLFWLWTRNFSNLEFLGTTQEIDYEKWQDETFYCYRWPYKVRRADNSFGFGAFVER